VKQGPLLIILFFGLIVAGMIVVTQSIADAIGSAASAYSDVGVATAEQEGQTSRWTIVTGFLSSLVGGATAALV
jgi:hypothetical protein